MEMHPGRDFYAVVHERLAQLARRLECENSELKRQMDSLLAKAAKARRH